MVCYKWRNQVAEIRSTLEMVLERAEKMGKASVQELQEQEAVREGMQLAASFLAGRQETLMESLGQQGLDKQLCMLKGVVEALLRNITLPRTEEKNDSLRAMQGLLEVGGNHSDLTAVFAEMKQILDRYVEHKKQVRQQLESAFQQQLQQAASQQGAGAAAIDPTLHPKFNEEWQRLQGELNSQYGKALEQHKALVGRALAR
jgi:hypothetical protein